MSVNLWRFYLENDVDKFRQILAEANYTNNTQKTAGVSSGANAIFKIGSPSTLATSPRTPLKSRKSIDANTPRSQGRRAHGEGLSLTRADINSKDSAGCTILHHAASSVDENAYAFIQALLEVPFIDLYTQDAESGWTALHRALYFGNISAAQALMLRDIKDATDYASGLANAHMGGLIKIKDHEGNSPFEVFGLTVASRDLHRESLALGSGMEEEDDASIGDGHGDGDEDRPRTRILKPKVNLHGDEGFTFGSNKNLTLGLGDEDDRQYPERPLFERPEHLLNRFYQEHLEKQARVYEAQDLGSSQLVGPSKDGLPAVIKNQPLTIQNIVMSKLSTAVITNDPESNLFMTGFGPGGRLGTGDEATRFRLVCVESGGLSGKKIIEVALGQDHSIAISDKGEVFTWGTNKFGQLGYSLPPPSAGQDVPMQLLPRQLYGPMKKEMIIGAAASATHSAIFTSTSLYTFGKNDGQLGLMDADARSLVSQNSPRRVGVNILQSAIQAVSAIDQATIILLESHDVIVLTNYGWTKVVFPLESFHQRMMTSTIPGQYYSSNVTNHITKVTSGGDTICALSAYGEVFTLDVSQRPDARSAGTSTTHPARAKNALPTPSRVWSIRKSHMAARDVALGQHGSIILCTESGSVWRKEKRAKLKDAKNSAARGKDYKFVRVPTLTRAVAVRGNAFGAFAAVRKDTDVSREQIETDPQTLWGDLLPLLSFRDFKLSEDSDDENPRPRFWNPYPSGKSPATIKQALLLSKDAETEIQDLLHQYEPLNDTTYDVWIVSNVTDVRIPAHTFMLSARSPVLRRAFDEFQQSYFFTIPDILSIEYGKDGQVQLLFHGADFWTLINLVFYVYCENVVDIWHHTRSSPQSAARYRQIRRELMDISQHLDLKGLERAARLQVDPSKRLNLDMENAFADEDFFLDGDIAIQLAGDTETKAHSALVCLRCPFFEGMFNGRAAGKWVASRRDTANDAQEAVQVDLEHVDPDIFTMVLRHIYADTGVELFDEVVTKDLDEFLDIVLEVMSVANELMLNRLSQICQKVLGRYVNIRNICYFLNAVAPCTVEEFKRVGLEYICLNLEVMLENRLLEELDEDLLIELDAIVQSNQIEHSLIARSGKLDEELFDQHPELVQQIEISKQRKIDSMRLKTRLHEDEDRYIKNFRIGSVDRSPNVNHKPSFSGKHVAISPDPSPVLRPKSSTNDLFFNMDDDEDDEDSSRSPGARSLDVLASPSIRPQDLDDALTIGTPKETEWTSVKGKSASRSFATSRSMGNESPMAKGHAHPISKADSRPMATTTGFDSSSKPWGAAAPSAAKTDLKDILAQDTPRTMSNLSLAIDSSKEEAARPSFGSAKMSQKERKKMLQQEKEERMKSESQPLATPWTPGSQQSAKSSSPWKTVKTAPASAIADITQATGSAITPAHSSSRSNMTLRQTVAGTPAASSPQSQPTASTPKQNRSVSGPSISQPPSRPSPSTIQPPSASAASPNPASSSQQTSTPQIQSIRHTPLPSQNSFNPTSKTSLQEILHQQQSEKAAIVEARTSKRSLQEIQAEQEFLSWWDEESRRLKEEEELAVQSTQTRPSRGGGAKASRGGGGKRGASTTGRGRGGKPNPNVLGERTDPAAALASPLDSRKALFPSTLPGNTNGNAGAETSQPQPPLTRSHHHNHHSRGGGDGRGGGGGGRGHRGRGRGRGGPSS